MKQQSSQLQLLGPLNDLQFVLKVFQNTCVNRQKDDCQCVEPKNQKMQDEVRFCLRVCKRESRFGENNLRGM